jgi:hypothetical protein
MVSVPCLCDGDNCDWNWDASIVKISDYAYCPDDVKGQFTCPVLGSTCVNNDTLCKDGEYYVCEKQRWSYKRDCAAGCASNQKACRETSCENGDTLCKDGRYYVCENGSWGNGTKCEHYLCENDKVCKADDSCSKKTIYMKDRDGWCVDGQAISCSNDGKLVATNCADTNSFCYIDGVMGTAGCLKNVHDGVNIESCSADDFLKETSSCVFIPGEEGGTYYGDGGDNYYITRSCRRPVSTLDSASYTAGNNYDQILTAMKCHHGCDASKGGCNERFFNEDGLCTPALHECKIDHCSRGALDGDHWSDKTKYSCMCMNHECKLTTTQTSEIDHCVEGTEVIECTDYSPIYGID